MRRPGLAVLAALIGVGAKVVFVWLAPHGVVGPLLPELSGEPHPFAEPLVASIELAAAALFAVAAARFALMSEERRDPFLSWLGVGSVLGATASLNYALFPTLNPGWLLTGDIFRVAAVTAWALGALGEIVSYWSEIRRLAQAGERRRLARDLHDGLAQELAFLVSHVQAPTDKWFEPEWLDQLGGAAQRALAESRRAIALLVADASLPLEADLERTAADIAARTGAHVDLDVCEARVEPGQQALGATFAIRSEMGHGTTVEIVWP